ncbi:MAG: hypothetical protein IH936_15560 [Acidobacteria bacterium]|nr:hypothetical protein [Acidobacteriota bacterium]
MKRASGDAGSELRLTAYHEAGHRVASIELFADRVRDPVSIRPIGDTLGRSPEEEIPELTEEEIVVYYTGPAAEVHFDPFCQDSSRAPAWDDDEKADSILRELCRAS